MEQTTAKQLFISTLTRLDTLLNPHQAGLQTASEHC
jgi:hypothetical protein